MNVKRAKQEVINAGKAMVGSGLMARTWGNLSCRINDEAFLINAKGRDYLTLLEEDVVEVKISGLSCPGKIKPATGKMLHGEIYKLKPLAGFVIHTHQNNASALSALEFDEIRFDKSYCGIGDKVLCARHGLPGSKKLSINTIAALKASSGKAVLMQHHGAVCYGENFEEAFQICLNLEEACGEFLNNLGVGYADKGTGGADDYLWNDSLFIVKFSESSRYMKAYLDDFAQLIGARMGVIDDNPELISIAIKNKMPVIIRGRGALCIADKEEDMKALSEIIEKNCHAYFAGGKPLGRTECLIMHDEYLKNYIDIGTLSK
ncbi:MAG: class II aldolase/adducin family protein [Clostridiales bacterium]|nr:class II aldolase/adducin family protein [Clostridiales bacterium]